MNKFKLASVAVLPALTLALTACNSDSDSNDNDDDSFAAVVSTCPTSEFITITPANQLEDGTNVCALKGYQAFGELTLDPSIVWALDGTVYIGDDQAGTEEAEPAELREYEEYPEGYVDAVVEADDTNHINRDTKLIIPAGTRIFGADGPDALVIQRDAQIEVNGTSEAPVIMTSAADIAGTAAETDRGKWGGLVLNGNANNNKGTDVVGEGFTGEYGLLGDDTFDGESSGVINYLVVKYAGYKFTPENELNGVAFQAVGSGTEVDYLQVHNNSDDGVEFFGGSVNVKHVVLTGNDDDSMDWTYGWTGRAQFVYIEQTGTAGDKGIEADSHKSPLEAGEPQSSPMIANLTIIAVDNNKGMETRVSTNADFYNAIVTTTGTCVDFDDADDVNFENSVLECGTVVAFDSSPTVDEAGEPSVDQGAETDVIKGSSHAEADITVPTTGAAVAVVSNNAANDDLASVDAFFEDADYFGAVDEAGTDWTAGWTHAWK